MGKKWGLIGFLLVFSFLLLIFFTSRYDPPPQTKTFLDQNGEVIGSLNTVSNGSQIWTPLDQIPKVIVAQTIQKEDRFFYWHGGINVVSIAKALLQNLTTRRTLRGASTITQQLARNLIQEKEGRLSPRTWNQKIAETVLAVGLELKHSKAWILERYLNTIYYGNRSYGITAAGQIYFSKNLQHLTADEIAFLVDLPRTPSRDLVSQIPSLRPSPVGRHFLEWVSRQAPSAGPVVQTTLDLSLQKNLETMVQTKMRDQTEKDPKLTTAIVVIEATSGDLLAMIGSRDYFNETIDGSVNVAVSLRQPGSALKPFTYFAALTKGFGPHSILPDEPLSFQSTAVEETESYAPQNFDRRYHGSLTLKEALANSYNIPAVVTLNEIGLSYFHDLLKKFGITTLQKPPPHYGLAVTLGSGEITLLELTNAYAALAREGNFLPVRFLKERKKENPTTIVPGARQFATEITAILSDPLARVKSFGFNEAMAIEGHAVALKTGTSFEHRDNWALGYSPSYAVGVWVGHADGTPMDPLEGATGATFAAPLWHAVMENLLRGESPEPFFTPLPRQPEPQREIQYESVRLLSPVPNTTYRIHSYLPRGHQKILAEAEVLNGAPTLRWYLDEEYMTTTKTERAKVWLIPTSGKHRLAVESAEGDFHEVPFKVIDPTEESAL